ncbi:MAG: 4'-phosphopantetheinyl transferase superfamily protein [Deltaproteobacteria bacterium]|nr:4'-phosphopantetheinyl transferase superfamily protein [Deltaproteobacteria bacterium]
MQIFEVNLSQANAHAALKFILGKALGQKPEQIKIQHADSGKPWHPDIYFSLSHSQNRALIVVSSKYPVGIDLEFIRPIPQALNIARRFFAPCEYEALVNRHPGPRAGVQHWIPGQARDDSLFFDIWTAKEALIKAKGLRLLEHIRTEVAWPRPGDARYQLVNLPSPLGGEGSGVRSAHLAFQGTKDTLKNLHVSNFCFEHYL